MPIVWTSVEMVLKWKLMVFRHCWTKFNKMMNWTVDETDEVLDVVHTRSHVMGMKCWWLPFHALSASSVLGFFFPHNRIILILHSHVHVLDLLLSFAKGHYWNWNRKTAFWPGGNFDLWPGILPNELRGTFSFHLTSVQYDAHLRRSENMKEREDFLCSHFILPAMIAVIGDISAVTAHAYEHWLQ